jgi:hypothetical protein
MVVKHCVTVYVGNNEMRGWIFVGGWVGGGAVGIYVSMRNHKTTLVSFLFVIGNNY